MHHTRDPWPPDWWKLWRSEMMISSTGGRVHLDLAGRPRRSRSEMPGRWGSYTQLYPAEIWTLTLGIPVPFQLLQNG